MARQLKVSALNIAFVNTSFHDKAEIYKKFFLALYKQRGYVALRGDRFMSIGTCHVDERDKSILRGELYTMTEIDQMAWFNVDEHRPASDDERSRIRVPQNMRANYREYTYEFYTAAHRLVFVSHEGKLHLSSLQARYVFERLANTSDIVEQFGDVSVSVEQEPEGLKDILDAEDLRSLTILIRRPNAGLSGWDADIKEALDEIGAAQAQIEFKAGSKTRLKPDKDTRNAAKVALSDGVVSGTVRDEGVTKELSTEKHPISETIRYNPKKESRLLAIRRAGQNLLARIRDIRAGVR